MEGLEDFARANGDSSMMAPLGSFAERALRAPTDIIPRVVIEDGLTKQLFGEDVSPAEALVRTGVYCVCLGFSISTKPFRGK